MAKTVLITGASSGFGKDAAIVFKSKECNVLATLRTQEKAETWAKATGLFTPKLDVTRLRRRNDLHQLHTRRRTSFRFRKPLDRELKKLGIPL